jgi:hypothetical protein
MVAGVEPAVVGMAEAVEFADVDHGRDLGCFTAASSVIDVTVISGIRTPKVAKVGSATRAHGRAGSETQRLQRSARARLAGSVFLDQTISMNFDDQIRRYFGTSDLAAVPPEALAAGIEHMKVDLGLTKDRGERFALWALLQTLGSAPDLDVVFESEADREAARNFMDLIQGASGG